MTILPAGGAIAPGMTIQQQSQPTKTWYIDPVTNQCRGNVDGLKAIAQTVEAILNTERFHWQIYPPDIGMEYEGLLGQDPGYVASELQRRIEDALSIDTRVLGIEDFSYTMDKGSMKATVTVNTVYGQTTAGMEVVLQ